MDRESIGSVSRVVHGGSDDPRLLDFSANTNPRYPRGVAAVYESSLATARRYPSDDYADFRVVAAEYVGCDPRSVVPTAGGMMAIRLAFEVLFDVGDDVLVPAPSFGEYDREVRLQGADPVFVPHDAVLDEDPAAYDAVVLCNPNNPTGERYGAGRLRRFAETCHRDDTPLVVDEAFLDFTDQRSLAGTPGVVVARSLTKMFGLPGLRAGFAVGVGEHLDRLDAARPTWALSTPASEVGRFCLRQSAFVEATRERVRTERARMRESLAAHFEVWPSDAPFLLLDVGEYGVEHVATVAREHGIVVRDATTFEGLDSHVRVAVRMPGENDRLLDALAAAAEG